MTINEVIISGRLTADPETRYTQSNKPVCRFTLALDRYNGDGNEQSTDFIPCTAWGSMAEFVGKYFFKGKKAIVKGNLRTFSWTDQNQQTRYGWEVVAEKVDFADDKKIEASHLNNQPAYQNYNQTPPTAPPPPPTQPVYNQAPPAGYQQNPGGYQPPQQNRPQGGYQPPQNPPPQNNQPQNSPPQQNKYPWETA